jgi:hypothetical protein
MHKKTPKNKIKIVISTCKGYETFLFNILEDLDYKNHIDDIIIVQGRCDRQMITCHDGVPMICSTKNLFDYISFNMVAKYADHPVVNSDKYLFLHDTCEITDTTFFWKTLNELDKKTDDGYGFYYLCNKELSAGNNIGIGTKEFVVEYGSNFNILHSISKPLAITLECGKSLPLHPTICANADSVKAIALELSTQSLKNELKFIFAPQSKDLFHACKVSLPGIPWNRGPGNHLETYQHDIFIDLLKRLCILYYSHTSLSGEGSNLGDGTGFPILRIKKKSGRNGNISRVVQPISTCKEDLVRTTFPSLVNGVYFRYNIDALYAVMNGDPETVRPMILNDRLQSEKEELWHWLNNKAWNNLRIGKEQIVCMGDDLIKFPKEKEAVTRRYITQTLIDHDQSKYPLYFLDIKDLFKTYKHVVLEYKEVMVND